MSEIQKSFSTEKYVVIHTVKEEQDGWRLDQFVQKCMPTLSRQYLKGKIERGDVEISGRKPPHKPSVKVHANEKITITTHNDGSIEDELWNGKPLPRDAKPTVVFEDDELLVVNKPPFMITHPAGKNLFYCATVFFQTIYKKTIHSIHRIDRETSGLLLLGKNPKVAQRVSIQFEEDKVRKCYFFIAHKKPGAVPFPFTAKQRMDRMEGEVPMMETWPQDSSSGKESETGFELLLEKNDYVLAMAFPLTGRQHQIRLHAAVNGYPLLGEKLYHVGPEIFKRFKDHEATPEDHELLQIPRHALHATALKFYYPEDKMTFFIAPLPDDLAEWIETKLHVDRKEVEALIKAKVEQFLK
ncbi:MAG: pseudouridine synthase [Bacteriovoracaceae bacterium]